MSTSSDATLIDTSCWIEAMRARGDVVVRQRVAELLDGGGARFTDMVRLELANGLRGADQAQFLRQLEDLVDTLPTTPTVWSEARRLAKRARAAGITAPATDVLVFAAARIHGVALLHRDRHFDRLEEVATDAAPAD